MWSDLVPKFAVALGDSGSAKNNARPEMNRRAFAFTFAAALALLACGSGADALSQADESGELGAEGSPPSTKGATIDEDPAALRPTPNATSAGAGAGETSWVPMPYRGINLAGAEFGSTLPGVDGVDYRFPTRESVDYYLDKGMNTFRIGFKWERLQPAANGELTPAYADQLDALVSHATSRGGHVILNPHNFARYYGETVGSADVPNAVFADLWRRLARKYGNNGRVLFNLVNEPHTMPTEQWVSAANAAIAAIRDEKAGNVVIVPGNSWTGAHSWAKDHYGTPNAVAMLDVVDPIDNVLFEAHQYLDRDASGAGGECMSATVGRERLRPWVEWLRAHGKKGFVGELAGGVNPTCFAAIDDMAAYMMENADVVVGWLWWAGGPKWGDYKFSLEPKNGLDAPYMARLAPLLEPLTARVRVTSETAAAYCADVEVYDWAGTEPLEWKSATLDLASGAATSVVGGSLSAKAGTVIATPDAANAAVPARGRRTVSVCATRGSARELVSVTSIAAAKRK